MIVVTALRFETAQFEAAWQSPKCSPELGRGLARQCIVLVENEAGICHVRPLSQLCQPHALEQQPPPIPLPKCAGRFGPLGERRSGRAT